MKFVMLICLCLLIFLTGCVNTIEDAVLNLDNCNTITKHTEDDLTHILGERIYCNQTLCCTFVTTDGHCIEAKCYDK